jgi:uncharacterized membrane protein
MHSEKFRRQLRQEAQQWRAEGQISEAQFQNLSNRYQFDQINLTTTKRFTLILLSLGGVLIGLGAVALIAANWNEISQIGRWIVLFGLLFGLSGSGFALWNLPRYKRFGEILLLLGGVALGVNLAQVLAGFTLFFVWGIGVLTIAYGLRLKSLGMLAIALIGIGYWTGWNQIYFSPTGLEMIGLQMPIVAAILFLPLAYWCRSRMLFLMSAIAVCSALLSSLAAIVTKASVLPALLIGLPAALLWSYDDTLWTAFRPQGSRIDKPFQPIARQFGALALAGVLFWFSFHWVWNGSLNWYTRIPEWRSLPSVVILAGIAIGQWLYLLKGVRTINLNTIGVGLMIGLSTIVNFWHLRVQPLPIFAPILFNGLLIVLALGAIRTSLRNGKRRAFWFGILVLILQILSRLLEYETTLIIKSLVCILCGSSAIAAGLWFERRIRFNCAKIKFQ